MDSVKYVRMLVKDAIRALLEHSVKHALQDRVFLKAIVILVFPQTAVHVLNLDSVQLACLGIIN